MPRPYPPGFRARAIALVHEGRQVKQTAEDLGIHAVTLYNWLRQDDLLRELGFEGMEGREIIDELEALAIAERPADVLAAVRPYELAVSDASGRETSLALPEDVFYVSVAPFLEVAHDCYFHSLTTCTGELSSQDIEVLVTDETGDVLVEDVRTTTPNGFLGMWLPRDRSLTLTCSQDGMSATTPMSTSGDEAATCLTTLQMTA